MDVVQSVLAFAFVFGLLVLFHEAGHFLAAKLVGVGVENFSVGFGPALIHWRWGETTYALRVIPLGGFVRLAGMDALDREIDDGPVGSNNRFQDRSVPARMFILAAGPLMNFILAILLFACMFASLTVTVTGVVPGSPAQQAGLQAGDRLLEIAGEPVSTSQQVVSAVHGSGGRRLDLAVRRGRERVTLTVAPRPDSETGRPMLGVELRMGLGAPHQPILRSIWEGIVQTWEIVRQLGGLAARMISGAVRPELAGPIGIYQITGSAAEGGLLVLLSITAALSVHLGLFNLLPIPVLDGGTLFFLAVEGIRGRPLKPEYRGLAQMLGLTLLLLLLIFATLQDLRRLANPAGTESSAAPAAVHRIGYGA